MSNVFRKIIKFAMTPLNCPFESDQNIIKNH